MPSVKSHKHKTSSTTSSSVKESTEMGKPTEGISKAVKAGKKLKKNPQLGNDDLKSGSESKKAKTSCGNDAAEIATSEAKDRKGDGCNTKVKSSKTIIDKSTKFQEIDPAVNLKLAAKKKGREVVAAKDKDSSEESDEDLLSSDSSNSGEGKNPTVMLVRDLMEDESDDSDYVAQEGKEENEEDEDVIDSASDEENDDECSVEKEESAQEDDKDADEETSSIGNDEVEEEEEVDVHDMLDDEAEEGSETEESEITLSSSDGEHSRPMFEGGSTLRSKALQKIAEDYENGSMQDDAFVVPDDFVEYMDEDEAGDLPDVSAVHTKKKFKRVISAVDSSDSDEEKSERAVSHGSKDVTKELKVKILNKDVKGARIQGHAREKMLSEPKTNPCSSRTKTKRAMSTASPVKISPFKYSPLRERMSRKHQFLWGKNREISTPGISPRNIRQKDCAENWSVRDINEGRSYSESDTYQARELKKKKYAKLVSVSSQKNPVCSKKGEADYERERVGRFKRSRPGSESPVPKKKFRE
ncbi:high mobility group nucleosome-binding domain-containing protein 5 [Hyalella azteca]|uniref:High mobility group nucleosome-binding domain-containing protein 5 n=1 Tax=Hyalella azteca TaxID=294128 RepID=A0A8B7P213_HYAAZ|nr:high mobility group nucleosome-binding domain-containing protein 5 [Hyalella azteca]